MLAAFSCGSFALYGIRENIFGNVELCGGIICIGITLDGLCGGIGVFVGETVCGTLVSVCGGGISEIVLVLFVIGWFSLSCTLGFDGMIVLFMSTTLGSCRIVSCFRDGSG